MAARVIDTAAATGRKGRACAVAIASVEDVASVFNSPLGTIAGFEEGLIATTCGGLYAKTTIN